MGTLAIAFPWLKRVKLPLTRDQLMLLMAATNEIFLGVDIFLAHSISGNITPREWIPIIFGPAAGVVLLLAGLIARRRRVLATRLATVTFLASILVGFLGAFFHIVRAILPSGPIGARVTFDLLVWAPPILGPLTFSLVGILGISAAWMEEKPDSGRLILGKIRRLALPYSKTRAYFFLVSMGVLATVISSVLDHARTPFDNPWLWMPTLLGVFAAVIAFALGWLNNAQRSDYITYAIAMGLMMLTGVVGLLLHIGEDLTSTGVIVAERFLRGAPFLAPLLFADMGGLGVIAMLAPDKAGE
jgi:hypothetical protein